MKEREERDAPIDGPIMHSCFDDMKE